MSGGWELVTVPDGQNPVVGDLRKRGSRFARLDEHAAAVAQRVRVHLRWWAGEWIFDLRRGTPYVDELLGKQGITEQTIRAFVRREIESVAGVARVRTLRVTLDRKARHSRVDELVIETSDGERIKLTNLPIGER